MAPDRHLIFRRVAPLVAAVAVAGVASCTSAALPPDPLISAFVAASHNPARTLHLEWTGAARMGSAGAPPLGSDTITTFTGTFDLNGADFAGTIGTTWALANGQASGIGGTTGYARVSAVDFAHYEEAGRWERVDSGSSLPTNIDPTYGLTSADLAYAGPATFEQRSVFRLDVTDPAAALVLTLFPANATPQRFTIAEAPEYAIFVDGQGVPVGASLRLNLDVAMAADETVGPTPPPVPYRLSFEYRYSEWGSPVTISAPPI